MKNLNPLFPDISFTRPVVIAGPCSVESREQTLETATGLSKDGIKIFRGGVWKPRTTPGGFEGIGEEGLEWLADVKQLTGMRVGTEVANRQHVEKAIEAGLDYLWIGARTTTNPFAVQEIADALQKIGKDIPVLVKNPVNPDIELWIGALRRIYNAGITRLGAVHRGFSTYGTHSYRNMPHWRIPIELKRRYPDLPLFCDPSHITGNSSLIQSVAQQAMDLNFDGLLIESHSNPEEALSDKDQQLTPEQLKELLKSIEIRDTDIDPESLSELRGRIDRINLEVLELLARRMNVTREIGEYKKRHNMPVVQPQRYKSLMEQLVKTGEELGLSEEFVKGILSAIHEESVKQQLDIVNKKS